MNRQWYKLVIVVAIVFCVLGLPSCGHEQQLVSITIQPSTENFGLPTIPVSADAGLNVQLKALGSYIHPPVTKDITDQVTWASNTPQMVTVNSTGLITATGDACGGTLITATVITNKSIGNISSSGAEVIGTMTANVACFTGSVVRSGPFFTAALRTPESGPSQRLFPKTQSQ